MNTCTCHPGKTCASAAACAAARRVEFGPSTTTQPAALPEHRIPDDLLHLCESEREAVRRYANSYALAALQPKPAATEFNGWYCAHCQCGVDASEVTFHEQHTVCGRVITNDVPPAPKPAEVSDSEIVNAWATALPQGLQNTADLLTGARAVLALRPAQQATPEPERPDIIERLTYHQLERDDLSLDDCLDFLASGWKKVHGRTERQMVMQILALHAEHPTATPEPAEQWETSPPGSETWETSPMAKATPAPEWRDRLTVNLLRQGSGLTKNQIRALIGYAVDGVEPDPALFAKAMPEPVLFSHAGHFYNLVSHALMDVKRPDACGHRLRFILDELATLMAQPATPEPVGEVVLPVGWVPLTIEHEPGFPEEVAFGPQRMMDRLKKWLDKHFAAISAQAAQQVPMTEAWLDDAMRLADAYADACFDQGLNQRTEDPNPEAKREKLVEHLRHHGITAQGAQGGEG